MSFFGELRARHEPTWEACFNHPFVLGVADSGLEPARFRYYIGQDDRFLVEYARVLALAVAKSPDVATMGRFGRLLDTILNAEMALHRQFAARYGVGGQALDAVEMAPTTRAYTDHLARVAWSGGLGELVAALMPCQYGYL